MDQNIVKSINVRVTEEQKDLLDQMALEQNETLKDIILNGTIYSEEQKLHDQISNYKKEIKELEKLKQNEEQLNQSIKQQTELLSAKDELIDALKEQLEQTNKRIDDYSRQLEQQQSLQLATASNNKELRLKLDTLEEEEPTQHKNGFFSRLFNR